MERTIRILSAFAISALMLSCSVDELTESTVEATSDSPSGNVESSELSQMLCDGVEIVFAEGIEAEETVGDVIETKALAGCALKMERVFPDAGEWEERHREAGLDRFYKVSFDEPLTRGEATAMFSGLDGIVSVEACPEVKPCSVNLPFNDPYARSYQWHLYNDGTLVNGFVAGCDIDVVPVWNEYTGGSSDVIVSVVDNGIDLSHPDLAGVVLDGGENGSRNFVDNDYNIIASDHGTHVAGLIGAINNNGLESCGVAGGLDGKGGVKLMSCQIFKANPSDASKTISGNIPNAIIWGADHGAVICNNSWAYSYSSETQAAAGSVSASTKAAIDYFIKYAGTDKNGNQTGPMKGGVVLFAAGNDGWAYGLPASYEPVIAVGATGPDALRATYSNYGSWVDICAPGGEHNRITTSTKSYILSLAIYSGSKRLLMCGTSMSCPIVSGVAALIVSQFGGDGFTNDMLKEILLSTQNTTIIPESEKIKGMVDAYAAFKKADATAITIVSDYSGNYKFASVEDATVTFTANNGTGTITSMSLESDGSAEVTASDDTTITVRFITSEETVGKHTATINAISFTGKKKSKEISYEIYVNKAPVINFSGIEKDTILWHESRELDAYVIDPEGQDGMEMEATVTPSEGATVTQSAEGFHITLGEEGHTYSVRIKASDKFKAGSEASKTVTILGNRAPEAVSVPDDIIISSSGGKELVDGNRIFTDPDGEALFFSSEMSNTSVAKVTVAASSVIIRSGEKEGVSTCTVTASDNRKASASASFRVGVYNDAKGPTLYPNPVSDNLNVRIGAEKSVEIEIVTETGATVLRKSGTSSIFNEMSIDLSTLSPGRYKATVKVGNDASYEREIVKI